MKKNFLFSFGQIHVSYVIKIFISVLNISVLLAMYQITMHSFYKNIGIILITEAYRYKHILKECISNDIGFITLK